MHDVFEAGTNSIANGVPRARLESRPAGRRDCERDADSGSGADADAADGSDPYQDENLSGLRGERLRAIQRRYLSCTGSGKPVGYRGLVSQERPERCGIEGKESRVSVLHSGRRGQRPPHPPLDFAPDEDNNGNQK